MMKFFTTIALSSFLLASSIMTGGCTQKKATFTASDSSGLTNPSIHIQVIKENISVKGTTFGWGISMFRIPEKYGVSLTDIGTRISASLTKELTVKGMRFQESEPDYFISYAIAFASEIHEVELNNSYADLLKGQLAHEQSDLYYKQGVMIIDVVNRRNKTLLWRGAILAEPDINWPEERKQERCDTAVHDVLKYFPNAAKPQQNGV